MTEPTSPPTSKKSDLGVRTLSAIVMVAVAGTALWLGGWVWTVFVAAVALGVLWEWRGLVVGFEPSPVKRGLWNAGGLAYVGGASYFLNMSRATNDSIDGVVMLVGVVMAIDIGAYFSGRSFGGPKIAPRISPSKTWAGLIGGCLAAAAFLFLFMGGTCVDPSTDWATMSVRIFLNCIGNVGSNPLSYLGFGIMGAVAAIIAQSGDFFESWMKRRANVKDSGSLIPGHGGLFDRVDGLLALSFFLPIILKSLNIISFYFQ